MTLLPSRGIALGRRNCVVEVQVLWDANALSRFRRNRNIFNFASRRPCAKSTLKTNN